MKLFKLFKNSKLSQQERRIEKRHPSYFSAVVNQQEKVIDATIVNFSKSGLGLKSSRQFKTNETFEVDIAMNSERQVKVKFDVLCCQKTENGYLIGTKVSQSCKQYQGFFKKMSQPRHTVMSDCW